jgi:hypothetical protein
MSNWKSALYLGYTVSYFGLLDAGCYTIPGADHHSMTSTHRDGHEVMAVLYHIKHPLMTDSRACSAYYATASNSRLRRSLCALLCATAFILPYMKPQ